MINEEKLSTLRRFRMISLIEGISMIVLLFIAMPLKYGFDMPLMVKYVGWIHGILFMVYIVILIPTSRKLGWTFLNTFMGLVASVLPFGPFLFDRKLKNEERLMQQ